MDPARARLNMVENQLRPNRIEDPRLIAAMREVPRERFVPKALRGVAYADEDLALPDGRYLIEPLALARLIQAARIRPSDVVLVLGCSTGYVGTVVARLAGTAILVAPDEATGRQIESLLEELGADNMVVVINPSAETGHPDQAPFDVILLAGSVGHVPQALLDQIGEGGRLVAVIDDGRIGKGTVFTRLHEVVGSRVQFDAQIPGLPGFEKAAGFAL
jgi:protein-L-isoaspartate(D-aspartate) O-methyltransferase